MELADFQQRMADTYGERDGARGVAATVAWLAEETGELAKAVRKGAALNAIQIAEALIQR
jgi:NTP pyrophosphatase (non-canonical NTP hydrolase)